MSCARDGLEQGIVYKLLQEVEKEVILTDPSPSTEHLSSSQHTMPSPTPQAPSEPIPMPPIPHSAIVEASLPTHVNPSDGTITVPAPMVIDVPSGNSLRPTPAASASADTAHDAVLQVTSDNIRGTSTSAESRVLKTIKKWEMQILCSQHNPVRVFVVCEHDIHLTPYDH